MVRKSPEQIYIRASIDESPSGDLAWEMINDSELSCLSVGPCDAHLQAEVDGVKFYDRWSLNEVSLVRRGLPLCF